MNNTEKLLRAFIEAQGFDVEAINKTYINGVEYDGPASIIPVTPMDNVTHTTDYKVTKREPESINIHPDDLARLITSTKGTGIVRIIE